MAIVPPDPGKVQALLDEIHQRLDELEKLATAHQDPVLAFGVRAARSLVEHVQAARGAGGSR